MGTYLKIILSIFLLLVSFLGMIFFRRYSGTVIEYPFLWHMLFIAMGLVGAWIMYTVITRETEKDEQAAEAALKKFKSNAQKFMLDFDRCEFRNGSFTRELTDYHATPIEFIAPRLASKPVVNNVIQSYLAYHHSENGKSVKYVSQPFPFDATALKFYVISGKITLYIDRFEEEKYYFELVK